MKTTFHGKKNQKSTISQWGWKQSPQTWISVDVIMQIRVLKKGSVVSLGVTGRVSREIHRHCHTEWTAPWHYLSLSSYVNPLITEVVKVFFFFFTFYFTLWTFKLTPLSTDIWITVTCDSYSVFFITECHSYGYIKLNNT